MKSFVFKANQDGRESGARIWALAAALLIPAVCPTAFAFQFGSGGGGSVVQPAPPIQVTQPQINSATYQGSDTTDKATAGVLDLSLDDAIARGLKFNLGLILTSQSQLSSRGSQLQQLQTLLPTINATFKEAVQQTDLQALGLRSANFPAIIGPYGYTDLRASLTLALLNVSSLQNYLASKHNFASAQLSVKDARDMVVLTVGNAYLTCIADQALIESTQAQVDTSKVSLDQAVDNHQAGTSPLLDELRARVDYQTQQQSLITATNQYEKDKIALARAIGLPLEQKFKLTDQAPYAALDNLDPDAAVKQALGNRNDLKAMQEQVIASRTCPQGRDCGTLSRASISPETMAILALTLAIRTVQAMRPALSTCHFSRKPSCGAMPNRRSRNWIRSVRRRAICRARSVRTSATAFSIFKPQPNRWKWRAAIRN